MGKSRRAFLQPVCQRENCFCGHYTGHDGREVAARATDAVLESLAGAQDPPHTRRVATGC
ncbi:hypothetical protein D623_10025285 [Myotis brandtii]|uniref:Uncharacterized protein n=1 Tax=Myotis brandtii TaxID=109478 RepID=S7NEQ2_MYOBR|nr:hypothetical protein D623_10025285 [Myotis brandtii]